MKKLNNLIKSIIYVCVAIIIAFFVFYIDGNIKNSVETLDIIELDEGWDVTVNGREMKNATLSTLTFETVDKGAVLELSTQLPNRFISHPTLVFRLYHCIIDGIYLDNECIYKYGRELADNNIAVGTGNFVVNMPEDYMGKTLRMKLTVNEDNSFNYIETINIENQINFMSSHIRRTSMEFVVGVFQVTFAIIIFFVILFIGKFSKEYRKLLWIGGISIGSGMWTLCYYNISEFFIESRGFMTYLEHLGLYCVVPAISMFYSESIKTKIAKKMTLLLAIYGFLFTLILSILQRMNVIHISQFLVAFHIYSAVFCIITLTFLFIGFREKAKSEKIICIGTMLLIVGGAIALVSYNMVKFADEGIRQNLNILPIATTSFITIMMISYIEYLKEMVEESVDKKVLLNMAYNDILTGLANRGKCDSVLEELDEEKRDNYGIICLDLNNLKVINDTKGHLVGDNYICQFADILEYSFGEDGTVGRIGGDEFIVIIKDILNIDIKKRMTEMLFLAESNTDDKGREFPISFAYGYVTGAEDGIMSAEEACELADKRMYKCKENQKAGRK